MAYKANFEPNPELANLNPNRGTWERIEGKLTVTLRTGPRGPNGKNFNICFLMFLQFPRTFPRRRVTFKII